MSEFQKSEYDIPIFKKRMKNLIRISEFITTRIYIQKSEFNATCLVCKHNTNSLSLPVQTLHNYYYQSLFEIFQFYNYFCLYHSINFSIPTLIFNLIKKIFLKAVQSALDRASQHCTCIQGGCICFCVLFVFECVYTGKKYNICFVSPEYVWSMF